MTAGQQREALRAIEKELARAPDNAVLQRAAMKLRDGLLREQEANDAEPRGVRE